MNSKVEHLIRTILVVVVFLVLGGVYLWAPLDQEGKTLVMGALLAMGPAVLDVLRVFRKTVLKIDTTVLLVLLTITGCGGADVIIGEGARATSCIALQEAILAEFKAGHLSHDDARRKIDCVRDTCTGLHNLITEGHDAGE